MDTQIKKGIVEMCILHKLKERDYYGYDLMQELQELNLEMEDSSFYAILRRLNKEGLAEVYCGTESKGPQRKYYRITQSGMDRLEEVLADWDAIRAIVRKITNK